MALFDGIVQKVNKAAQTVSDKAKDGVEISRLSSESKSVSAEFEKLCAQIGRTYLESSGEATEELRMLAASALELKAKLYDLERRKMLVRNQNLCPNCGSVMAAGTRYCSNCGTKMPEPAPAAAPEPEAETPPEPETAPDAEANDSTIDE